MLFRALIRVDWDIRLGRFCFLTTGRGNFLREQVCYSSDDYNDFFVVILKELLF